MTRPLPAERTLINNPKPHRGHIGIERDKLKLFSDRVDMLIGRLIGNSD